MICDSEPVRVSGQDECDEGFDFDLDSCTCQAQIQCTLACSGGKRLNPLKGCQCITESQFNKIYDDNDLGPFCGNKDNIKRADNPKQCKEGEEFSNEFCACVTDRKCKKLCPKGQKLNPFEICECISEEDYNLILDHGLGSDCRDPKIVEPPSCKEGQFYDEKFCACVPIAQCERSCRKGKILSPFKCKCVD